jgi:hypothetical protein
VRPGPRNEAEKARNERLSARVSRLTNSVATA